MPKRYRNGSVKRGRRRRSWKRKYLRGRSGFAKAVKSVILKTAEKKYIGRDLASNSNYDILIGGNALNHNSVVETTLINNTNPNSTYQLCMPQGDSDGQRNGDEIYAKGIRLRSVITVPPDRRNAIFKLFLVEYNTTQGSPIVKADLFHQALNNVMIDGIQTDRWKLHLLGSYRLKSRDLAGMETGAMAARHATILVNKWIPFRRKLTYIKDDSLVYAKGMKERLSLIWMTFDATNALELDTCGYVRQHATLYYGDP